MRKLCFFIILLILASFSLSSSPYAAGHSMSDVSGVANADVVLNYHVDFARIGFTSAKVSEGDFAAKTEISEVLLEKNSSDRNATSGSAEIWSFWQINNSNEYRVTLSSEGIKSSDGKAFSNWSVEVSEREDGSSLSIKGDGDKSAVIKTKTGNASDSGSCRLFITVSDYPSLPAGSFTLPIVLTLESIS